MPDSEYYIREFDIKTNKNEHVTIKLHQKTVGDVNCIVWDASMVLAKYLETKHSKQPNCLQNLNVIELGSGVGCVGLTAALLGANVTLTDLPEALRITKDNIAFNKETISASKGSATAKVLNWGEKSDICTKDNQLLLLSDCIYYTESIKPLIQTLIDLSSENTVIIQCQEIRDTQKQKDIWNNYLQEVQQHFNISEVPEKDQHPEFTCKEIKVLKLSKK